ncbi:ATP-dependent DNA helicase [uncultured Propionibacterium sp.]|uniref:ATP-dependent DNA helicase n=1 Tax=uncultured Propionibacterium sp. TaxID=218066 RepID=UPI002930148B|nr:ATP-dependent DNA helicase [uncultured Propionibacterium sp.]
MAGAVARALAEGTQLLVQAGTGTGKSLGYLAPALVHAQASDAGVVVATATIALQNQLATKDVPAAAQAVAEVTGRLPVAAVLKGRSNYACLMRSRGGAAPEQSSLLTADALAETARNGAQDAESGLGAEVVALRSWVEEQAEGHGLADRDDAPAHSGRAWAQVSISSRECPGARCPFHDECFVEISRARARAADLVITNHALLAIDAMGQNGVLPEHDAVIIDEAHELTDRVTGAAGEELGPQRVERVCRRGADWLDDETALDLLDAADALRGVLEDIDPGRVGPANSSLVEAVGRVRDAARRAAGQLGRSGSGSQAEPERSAAAAAAREVFETAERMAAMTDADVVWISEREHSGRWLNVAPLSVAGLLRSAVLARATTVLTSATLALGGSFEAMAGRVGLRAAERLGEDERPDRGASEDDPGAWLPWRGVDVGSPFDYARQGILYVAAHLARPGREGIGGDVLEQVAELVRASGGHALGLFSSQRAAEAATRHVRLELPKLSVLCQGEAQLPELTRRFAAESETSLFGTMSLWQGIDVPGDACRLVIIDRIPFPRPDDPLVQARQQSVTKAGGNGFMQVAASHAALLLAQGAGRLIRRSGDRGVVAVLDSRLATARYGSYLRRSLPDFWTTTDLERTVGALRRLDGSS